MVAGNAERVISGAGDRIYVRGSVEENAIYGIFPAKVVLMLTQTLESFSVLMLMISAVVKWLPLKTILARWYCRVRLKKCVMLIACSELKSVLLIQLLTEQTKRHR